MVVTDREARSEVPDSGKVAVKRNLGPEKGEGDDGEGESAAEECAALRKAMAAAQSIAPALQAEVEEEHLAKVRMELR